MHEQLQNALAARKLNESDLRKLDRWCKEAEMKCNVEPSLDCATELLEEQVKQYKVNAINPVRSQIHIEKGSQCPETSDIVLLLIMDPNEIFLCLWIE